MPRPHPKEFREDVMAVARRLLKQGRDTEADNAHRFGFDAQERTVEPGRG